MGAERPRAAVIGVSVVPQEYGHQPTFINSSVGEIHYTTVRSAKFRR